MFKEKSYKSAIHRLTILLFVLSVFCSATIFTIAGNVQMIYSFNEYESPWSMESNSSANELTYAKVKKHKKGVFHFKGWVETLNEEDYALTMSPNLYLNLEEFDGISIKLKGDGKKYGILIKNKAAFKTTNYVYSFRSKQEVWQTLKIPFSDFQSFQSGKMDVDGIPLTYNNIRNVGIITTEDAIPGEFEVAIDWIKAYKDEQQTSSHNRL